MIVRTIFLAVIFLILATVVPHDAAQKSRKVLISRDSTEIYSPAGDNKRALLLHVDDFPDTVPLFFPHSRQQRFQNIKFNHFSVSPNDNWVAFVSGTDDQWLGVYNCSQQYEKFIVFGIQTRFYDLLWSPDSKYLAYGFKGPDRRLLVHLLEPPGKNEDKPRAMNGWQKLTMSNENLRLVGWELAPDTAFVVEVLDSLGSVTETQRIPLRRPLLQPPSPNKTGQ